MEELLKAILMEQMTDHEKEICEAPVTISFTKEKGIGTPMIIKLEGHMSALLSACECLVLEIAKKADGNKMAQDLILKLMFENIKRDLELK